MVAHSFTVHDTDETFHPYAIIVRNGIVQRHFVADVDFIRYCDNVVHRYAIIQHYIITHAIAFKDHHTVDHGHAIMDYYAITHLHAIIYDDAVVDIHPVIHPFVDNHCSTIIHGNRITHPNTVC